MADIIKGYKISYAPHSASTPTTWTELKGCVRSLPNFFPEPDTQDTTTVDMTMKTSIEGLSGGESYNFTIAPNEEFLTAHTAMVTDQHDSKKGYFWMKVELTNRKQQITGKFTTVTYLPTPEGSAGDLDEVDVPFYAYEDLTVSPIPSGASV